MLVNFVKMVEKETTRIIDKGIKEARSALTEMPEELRTRSIQLRMNPDEVISKIKQIDGLIIEFEERG